MIDFFVCEKKCEFSKVSPTFIKGSIRKIEKTNLSYIEPHEVIVKNITLKVDYLINMINDMDIKDKLRLAICYCEVSKTKKFA